MRSRVLNHVSPKRKCTVYFENLFSFRRYLLASGLAGIGVVLSARAADGLVLVRAVTGAGARALAGTGGLNLPVTSHMIGQSIKQSGSISL